MILNHWSIDHLSITRSAAMSIEHSGLYQHPMF